MIIVDKVLLTTSHCFNLIIYCLSSKSFRSKIITLFCDNKLVGGDEEPEQLEMKNNEDEAVHDTNQTTVSFNH